MNNQIIIDEAYPLDDNMVILSRTDVLGNIVSYNQAFKTASGYSDAELLGINHRLLRHPDMPKQVFEDFWATIEADRSWFGVIKNRRQDGRYYWVEASVTPYFVDGIKEGYISVRYPATSEQIMQAETLYASVNAHKIRYPSSHRYANLQPNLLLASMILLEVAIGFFLLDTSVNLSSYIAVAMLITLMMVLPLLQFMLFRLSQPTEQHIKSIEEICQGNYRSHLSDNDEWSFALNQIKGSVAIHAAQAYDQSAMLLQQTGQLMLQKRKAEAAAKAKANFLANMSHEIRTPINAIIGFTDLALDEQETKRSHRFIGKIKHASQVLLNIVNDILDFSKIDSGTLTIVNKPYCLQRLMSSLENMFSSMAEAKGIVFSAQVDPALAPCYLGDDFRLQQILINLIGNAIKFTKEGSVSVALRLVGEDRICFIVKDTGIGISQDSIQQLFHAFQQGDDSITRQYGGTGLGLVISQRLVEAMGGERIEIDSVINEGSTFKFGLRVAPCSVAQMQALKSRQNGEVMPRARLSGRVLIVDDNFMNLEIAKALVGQFGLTAVTVNSGAKAIEAIQQEKFDLVLMDLQMPEMDGFEATKRIHQLLPSLPVIALTAAVFGEDKQKSALAGMVGHLTKPIDKHELYAGVFPWVAVSETPSVSLLIGEEMAVVSDVSEPVIDYEAGLAMLDGDMATYQMLMGMLQDQVLPELASLIPQVVTLAESKGEVSDALCEAIRRKLHALKSPVSGIKAMRLGSILTLLHDKLREHQAITPEEQEELNEAYHLTLQEVTTWLTQQKTEQ
jgi:PAS domain S-box-containing protein